MSATVSALLNYLKGQMGLYTQQWDQYKKHNVRGILNVFLLIIVGLPVTILLPLGLQELTGGDYPVYLQLGLLVIWLAGFTMLVIRYSYVMCPRCGTRYSKHNRGITACPQCGLRLLQEDP
jgi:hypothetical protein